ncbi:cell cycle checkpoint [Laetiporus sulphureus 93-53]|uniref:Checkpoint protein n=1 Tax=Laetiporus sulphureus 93-53 TaxID=1314785 RepID=A0A165E1Q0_9APHY|nr:cell cycle checkpoint [Laetiporus sulphureus 93-53]KZT06077.1 cell cycle checkpoint [Laetiporus sulphureus 93-53]
MRFRANIENVTTFYRIAQTIERLQKRCIIKFTENEMHIICNSDASEGSIQVWSQIKVPSLFTDYRIQSNANNEISLNLSTEALSSALRSASSPASTSFASDSEVVMKLAKKNDQAVLSFEISGRTRLDKRIRVAHDVRIEVMKPQDTARLKEPMCPEPEVHILLPPLAKLRTVVERMRPLAADVIAMRASGSGCLQLCAHTDNARVDVSWKNLTNPKMTQDGSSQDPRSSFADDDAERRDPTRMYGVVVSLKSLSKFLGSHIVSTTTIACICQGHCIILYVYIGEIADAGGVLTFYIPAIIDDA